jgi:hypothetical protein
MAYVHSVMAPEALALPQNPPRAVKRSLLGRLVHAIADANMRHAEHEIARYLESTGGKFTDSAEREIERRYLSNLLR